MREIDKQLSEGILDCLYRVEILEQEANPGGRPVAPLFERLPRLETADQITGCIELLRKRVEALERLKENNG